MKNILHRLCWIGKFYLYGFVVQLFFLTLIEASPSKIHLPNKFRPDIPENPLADLRVSGTVVDGNGDPIPGVTVSVEGAGIGTATDLEGRYSLLVPDEATLVFSFIGYVTQRIEVGDKGLIDVTLLEDMASLDEVVVVGYGVQRQRDVTGSISSVDEAQITQRSPSNIFEAIQ